MSGLPLLAFVVVVLIRLAWHLGCRKENVVTMHADIRVTIGRTRVKMDAITPAGSLFLEGTTVFSRGDYECLVRRAHEVGVVFDVARTTAAVEVAELERMLTLKKEGRK
jgi:hypothetical protein